MKIKFEKFPGEYVIIPTIVLFIESDEKIYSKLNFLIRFNYNLF